MWSLVPLRHNAPLNESVSIPLEENAEIGRRQLLEATANACGCRTGLCAACKPAMMWGVERISQRGLRLTEAQTLQVRGKNMVDLLRIDDTRVDTMMDEHFDCNSWTTLPIPIQNGTVLTFSLKRLPDAALEFQIVYTQQQEANGESGAHDVESMEVETPGGPQDERTNNANENKTEHIDDVESSMQQDESMMENESRHAAASDDFAQSSQSARHQNSMSDSTMRIRIHQPNDSTMMETNNDASEGDDTLSLERRNASVTGAPEQQQNHDLSDTQPAVDAKATTAQGTRLQNDAMDIEVASHVEESSGTHGIASVATNDNDNETTVPDESILDNQKSHIQEHSQMSVTCTQDLLEKIACDIDDCEETWPAHHPSTSSSTEETTIQSHVAVPPRQGADGSSHQTQDTAMATTRVGAQIVSGDEALLQQETTRASGDREELSVANAVVAEASRGSAFESTKDVTQEEPPTKKRRSNDAGRSINNGYTQTLNESGLSIELPSDENVENTNPTRTEHSSPRQFKVMFVKLGNSCSTQVLPFKIKQAKAKGAMVVDSLEENPTHLVIDSVVKAEKLAEKLNFGKRGIPKLIKYLEEHDIETVKVDWLEGPDRLENPKIDQLWTGLAFHRNKASLKRKLALPSKPKPESSIRVLHSFPTNDAISAMFHKLAKLHQECSLKKNDEFRALTNNLISGRAKFLDFEITPYNLDKVKKIKGIGESSAGKMKEFFDRGDGSCNRIEAFEKDKERMAVRAMKNIWGVGISKARDLMRLGYETIDQVRKDLESGDLKGFTPNQLIGAKYYEDFLERMTREEVEEIAGIVKEAVRERFPNANVTIMGSYRRGKEDCGDIDLLITDPAYLKTTPRGALGELVSRLAERGHISFHLTPNLEGMNQQGTTESQSSYDGIQNPVSLLQDSGTDDGKPSSSSYMGVFCSPATPGKMRRIDIKFYPHREQVFAAIYFVGNGWFNRSIRRWANRKNFSLDDHGLFPVARNQRTGPKITSSVFYPKTEREVFDRLGLVYKEPTDRNYFDDVIPLDETTSDWDPHSMTESELMRDAEAHSGTWVD